MRYRTWMLGAALLGAGSALAAADPADPRAAVAPLTYTSVLDGYRRHADVKVESWQAMNDNVGRIGGWRVYLKEAHQSDSPAPSPASQSQGTRPAKPDAAPARVPAHAH